MAKAEKTCPDCRCPLEPVKLLDATTLLIVSPAGFVEPRYTTPGSTEGLFRKMPIRGTVKGWICPECSRILLYGEPEAS
jgi:hypothetical protein